MKSLKILLLLVCCGFVACTVTKPLTSDVTPAEVTDLKLLEPYSYISMIKKGNRGELDDSISAVSKQLNIDALKSFSGRSPQRGDFPGRHRGESQARKGIRISFTDSRQEQEYHEPPDHPHP